MCDLPRTIEFSSTSIAMSGEIGWCSDIAKMQCISEFHCREPSENGAFGVAAGIGSVMRLSSCAAMVWVCFVAIDRVANIYTI